MDRLSLRAKAKINLTLDVLGKRPDGYHDLRMIMQDVSLSDRILLQKTSKYPIKLACSLPWLPTDNRNLAYRAADYLQKAFGLTEGLLIVLEKRIPVSAGLGGGSSDCAAVLKGMNRLFRLGMNKEELARIGKIFGADVPYCLSGGTMLAEGIGDRLTPLPPHPAAALVLAKPPVSLSTSQVFSLFTPDKVEKHPDYEYVRSRLASKDLAGVAAGLGNVLESVSFKLAPDIPRIRDFFLREKALGAVMSGSGPTVLAYYNTSSAAKAAAQKLRIQMPHVKEVFVAYINETR